MRGTRNPTITRVSRPVSRGPLRFFTTSTVRLRFPCGARMMMIATLLARKIAFANHGFKAQESIALRWSGGSPAHAAQQRVIQVRERPKHKNSSGERESPQERQDCLKYNCGRYPVRNINSQPIINSNT